MEHFASTTRQVTVSTNLDAEKHMKINCVLKKTNVHQTNVCSDTPKHANTSPETEFAGMEKDALMRIKESVMKIRKLKK